MKAVYIYKPEGKDYDFGKLLAYCQLQAEELSWSIEEVYADGWVDIPNGIEDLISDASKYEGVLFYSLEGVTPAQIKALSKTSVLACAMADFIKPGKSPDIVKQLSTVIKAKEYYKKLKSNNIRAGIKASKKRSGAAPFGMKYDSEGELVKDENYPVLEYILKLNHTGVSVSEIAKKVNMTTAKIYGIIKTWSD